MKSIFAMTSKLSLAAVAGATLAVISCGSTALAAPVTFNLTAPTQVTGVSATETFSGTTLTIKDALGTNQPTVASLVGTGGINQDPNNGLCAAFRTGPNLTGANKCQYLASTDASLTGFTFQFNSPVNLSSFQIFRPGGTTFGSLKFTSGSSTETLTFSNPGGTEVASGTPFTTLNFLNPFYVAANTPIFVDTSGTQFVEGETGSFRINNFNVDVPATPGPVPIIGAFAAFSMSRRLRKRISLAK
jgi:hypothetical protein